MEYTSQKLFIKSYKNGINGERPFINDEGIWCVKDADGNINSLGVKAQGEDGESFSRIVEYYKATLATDLDTNGELNEPDWYAPGDELPEGVTAWSTSISDTHFSEKNDNGVTYKFLWNVEGVISKINGIEQNPKYTNVQLQDIYNGGRVPNRYISYYAGNTTANAPQGQPIINTEDGCNSIKEDSSGIWGIDGLTADANNYLFEITFVEYTEKDENGKNLFAKISGPNIIGKNSADNYALILNNDYDVIAKTKAGE